MAKNVNHVHLLLLKSTNKIELCLTNSKSKLRGNSQLFKCYPTIYAIYNLFDVFLQLFDSASYFLFCFGFLFQDSESDFDRIVVRIVIGNEF